MSEQQRITSFEDLARLSDVILATGKELTLTQAIIIWDTLHNLSLRNPEEKVEDLGIRQEVEPKVDDPVEAVLFKLSRTIGRLNNQAELRGDWDWQDEKAIIAGDVVPELVNKNGREKLHRMIRGEVMKQDQLYEPTPEDMADLRRKFGEENGPFVIEWQVAFGIYANAETNAGSLIIGASFNKGLSDRELEDNYNPFSAAGLNLIEMVGEKANEQRCRLWVQLDEDEKHLIPIDYDLAVQLIKAKLPTEKMINQLLRAEFQNNEEYSMLAVALASTEELANAGLLEDSF